MLSIDSTGDYYRILAAINVPSGTVLMHLKGVVQALPTKYSIQVNEHAHLCPNTTDPLTMQQLVWPYLNHSCDPNAYIDVNTLQLIALKDIVVNEEVTFNYESTELQMNEPFLCQCKSPNCRGLVRGKIFSASLSLNPHI